MKSKNGFNTAANAPYRFEKSGDPSLDLLHQEISKLCDPHAREEELIALIKAAPAATQTKFFAGFELGTQNFMLERCTLNAGSDDDLAMLANAQPPEFFDSSEAFKFSRIALIRGLVKTLDVFYARTPGAAGMELLGSRILKDCPELSMGQRLRPDFGISKTPRDEATANYLRALDYLLAKAPDTKTRNDVLEYQLFQYGHFTSLIPEFEKRGLDVEKIYNDMHPIYFNRQCWTESALFTHLEDYFRAKELGIPITDFSKGELDENTRKAYWQAAVEANSTEEELIAFIQSQKIGISLHSAMSSATIKRGLSRVQDFLTRHCSHPNKAELANDAVGWVKHFFSPSEKPDPVHDQNILACLDVLIGFGASTKETQGAEIILAAAMKDHLELILPLVNRGCDLGLAKGMARNEINKDRKERELGYPVYSDGWGSHSVTPLTDEQIRRYTTLINYALPEISPSASLNDNHNSPSPP